MCTEVLLLLMLILFFCISSRVVKEIEEIVTVSSFFVWSSSF